MPGGMNFCSPENPDFPGNLELCTRCGKCIPECPSYQYYRNEAHSPRGRVFLALTLLSKKDSRELPESFKTCLMCGRCEVVCPNGVSFPKFLAFFLGEKSLDFLVTKVVPDNLKNNPVKALSWYLREKRDIQLNKSISTGVLNTEEVKKRKIFVFYSCGLKELYPGVLKRLKKRESLLGISFEVLEDSVCCGSIYLNLGIIKQLKKQALKNLEVLKEVKGEVLVLCSTCYWIIKHMYPVIYKGMKYEGEFKLISQKVRSGLEIFLKILENSNEFSDFFEKRTIFHLPCHLTGEEKLIKNKIKYKSFCCGSPKVALWLKGFQRDYKKTWFKYLEKKVFLATLCTGCYLNFKALLKEPLKVVHWLELV